MRPLIPICLVGFFLAFDTAGHASRRERYLAHLKMAKSFLVSGDLDRAGLFLAKVHNRDSKIYPVKRRYEAIVSFLKGDYEKSLGLLQEDMFQWPSRAQKVCLQKLITMALTDKKESLQRELYTCRRINGEESENNILWLDALKEGFGPKRHFTGDHNMVSAQIKLALYAGQEQAIIDRVALMPAENYEYSPIRELLGIAYYRRGHDTLAKNFLEGIDTPNADNVRGNMALEKKDYREAFRHFKKALEKKPLSLNALARALPLGLLLKEWQQGANLSRRLPEGGENRRELLSLRALFSLKQGDIEGAKDVISSLRHTFEGRPSSGAQAKLPRDISMMISYTSLMEGDKRELEATSHEVCRDFDGLNCWIFYQQLLWEDISQTLNRQDSPHRNFDIEALKEKVAIVPLAEEVFINQGYLDEVYSSENSP